MTKLVLAVMVLASAGAATAQSATDARGIAVVSAPGTAPVGANRTVMIPPGESVTVNPNQSSVFAATAASGNRSACTKIVTDRCLQSYEGRAVRKPHGRRRHR